jgi:hypothetical protein
MRKWLRSHLTYANVMVTILAFLVLGGGTALASYVISSNSQVGPGTISGHKPPSGAHSNIISGSLNGQDVANNSLTGADIADKSGVDTCVSTVRLGNLCFRAENFARPWAEAARHCANLNLRLPSFGEAVMLATTYDLPNVDTEVFWTDEIYYDSASNSLYAYAVADAPIWAPFNISTARETACVTTPTN